MSDVLFPLVVASNWAFSNISAWAESFSAPPHVFEIGDFLYCDTELMKVSNIIEDNGVETIIVQRGLGNTIPESHSQDTPMMFPSNIGLLNGFSLDEMSPAAKMNCVKSALSSFIPGIEFIELPVLFMQSGIHFVAGSANMVNAVVSSGTVYMTDPGCTLFRDAVFIPGSLFIGGSNAWMLYHCRMGELHCGSEAERYLPPHQEFWRLEEFDGWPFNTKGETP